MEPTANSVAAALGAEAPVELRRAIDKIKHCLSQLSEEQVWWRPDESQNAIGNLLLHMCGNLRQWVVAGIGGAPDVRERPKEFAERTSIPKAELLRRLDAVVSEAESAFSRLNAADLLGTRRIQGFDVTTMHAVLHPVTHFWGHTQEIIHITRALLGERYQFMWRPMTPEQGAPK
jgi:uncharacterized damage-inducible protein DinB